jgi:MFS family permease
VIVFTCCGINFAFGVYQAFYESLAQEHGSPFEGASPAQIDLIGTISIALMTIGAPFVIAWAKCFSPQLVSFVGGIVFGLSLVLASFGTALWHFQLTQGLLLGLGTSLSYMVSVTIAPTWFTARRGLAMGIILSGTGVGGLVWAPAISTCNDRLGFRDTLRLTGALSFALISAASGAMAWEPSTRARIQTEAASSGRVNALLRVPLVDMRVARTRKFVAYALGGLFQSAVYYVPVFFFAAYARTLGYSDTAGANFVALSNACNAIGKVIIGYAADRLGRLNTLFVTTLLSAAVTLGFWFPSTLGGVDSTSQGLFVTFAIFYGIFASAYVSLFPTSLVELFGAQNFSSVNGALYMIRGMASIVGTPVGGLLIRNTATHLSPKSYEGMTLLVSSLLFAATVAVLWARFEAAIRPDGTANWKWRA